MLKLAGGRYDQSQSRSPLKYVPLKARVEGKNGTWRPPVLACLHPSPRPPGGVADMNGVGGGAMS